ncbi:molybdopterin-synthase adenylyltransferase MoeB [Salaquimonas pukyongi]|uniref:molybdopterin-synthase adenylyltransferase MoeB n=1 Tax=Salaquimonas pukyongi TaxID=2712698 RepID=UPI00096BB2E2|nr:molybdopterin-synthase adenylyltransferase MoeB [Salaquimonas pukyongi]
MLDESELERYARHIVLAEVGGAGQQKLKAAKVLVIGAGGLGSPVLQYLAAAGVGTLGIADDDTVSLSNLQRQVIHDSNAVGTAKTQSAEHSLQRINPYVTAIRHDERLNEANAERLIGGYDLVVDGSDNFATRYLAADVCEKLEKPLVTAAVGRFDGTLTVLMPHLADNKGNPNPRYRDIFPDKPDDGLLPACAEAGILGALTGVMGSLQAMEAIKIITGVGEPLVGRLLMIDGKAMRFETIRYKRQG